MLLQLSEQCDLVRFVFEKTNSVGVTRDGFEDEEVTYRDINVEMIAAVQVRDNENWNQNSDSRNGDKETIWK